MCLKCESGSSRFQPGEGPSRGLLRDYEPSDGTVSSTSIYHHRSVNYVAASGAAVMLCGRWTAAGYLPEASVPPWQPSPPPAPRLSSLSILMPIAVIIMTIRWKFCVSLL